MALKNGVRMRDALGGGFGYVVWWLRLSWYSRTHLPPPPFDQPNTKRRAATATAAALAPLSSTS